MEGGGGGSCNAVEGGRGTCETVEGGTPLPVGVDAMNSSIFCLQSIIFATIASDSSISVSIACNSQQSRISLSILFNRLSFPFNCCVLAWNPFHLEESNDSVALIIYSASKTSLVSSLVTTPRLPL